MAQIKLFKLGSGWTSEHDEAADDITLNSFTAGAGPVMSPTGVDMNNTDLSEVQDIAFNNPATGTINQTAGNLVVDNIMAKERSNALTTSADILFPSILGSDSGQVDALRLPEASAVPTATPTASGQGFVVAYQGNLYVWDGSQWVNQAAANASSVQSSYTADTAISARDAVYISSAGRVSPTDADAEATARVIGLAVAGAAASASVLVQVCGTMAGFSGLTTGARYYLDGTTPGAITATVPPGNSQMVVQVGIAKSTTELEIQIIPLVIRNT